MLPLASNYKFIYFPSIKSILILSSNFYGRRDGSKCASSVGGALCVYILPACPRFLSLKKFTLNKIYFHSSIFTAQQWLLLFPALIPHYISIHHRPSMIILIAFPILRVVCCWHYSAFSPPQLNSRSIIYKISPPITYSN